MTPLLSVLIPSVPSRLPEACLLYLSLLQEAEDKPVEILMLTDNKQRSIGAKREALVQAAQGEYVAFVDDDDRVDQAYFTTLVKTAWNAPAADVLVFDSLCSLNSGPWVKVTHGLQYDNQQYNPAGFTRKPWHIHAWHREIAQRHHFPDISYGEDWPWCESMLKEVKTQARAGDRPLYFYRFDSKTTEAPK